MITKRLPLKIRKTARETAYGSRADDERCIRICPDHSSIETMYVACLEPVSILGGFPFMVFGVLVTEKLPAASSLVSSVSTGGERTECLVQRQRLASASQVSLRLADRCIRMQQRWRFPTA